jgi:hypothetical protein
MLKSWIEKWLRIYNNRFARVHAWMEHWNSKAQQSYGCGRKKAKMMGQR